MKFKVQGTTTVDVYVEVEARNREEALAAAFTSLNCLTAFCGNGGTDRLIGISSDVQASIKAEETIRYDTVEETKGNDIPDQKTFWGVTTSIDDRGHVVSHITSKVHAETMPVSTFTSTKRRDVYVDWFTSEEEAGQFVNDSKRG
uniref:hypothetical protein n=1 Tax=Lachnoclostridium phocaeense TaxID=1871021 RepID=UPI0026DAB707|nr:hypothetical protein [Lachnoclostridium phocaeense]